MQVRGGSGTLDHLLVENCSHQACAIWGELMGLCVSDRPPDFRDVHVRRAMLELSKNTTGNGTPIMTKDPPEGPNSSARFTHAGGLHDLAGHGCRTAVKSRRRVVLDGWRDRARSAPLTDPSDVRSDVPTPASRYGCPLIDEQALDQDAPAVSGAHASVG